MMLDRNFFPRLDELRQIEDEIVEALNFILSGKSVSEIVTTDDANGFAVKRFVVKIGNKGQAVLLPVPNSFGQAEMTDFQLLVVCGLWQRGFEGHLLTGSPYKIGSVANG